MPTLIMTALANRMDGSIKAKAMTFLQKLSVDDTTSGLHIEKINGSADPKARTGRVDKFWRAVLFRIDTKGDRAYVVHGVWPHDDAIAEARRTILRINPINGLPEFEKVEPAAPASPPAWTPEVPPTSDSTEPFLTRLGVSRDDLVDRLGLPAAVADAAMAAADEDAVLAIAEQHEGWVGLLLVDVAAGEPIDEIAKRLDLEMASKSGDENEDLIESFNRPAARAQFTFIDDQEELRRVIEAGDFGAWRVFLHPEQRKYVERRYNGPFRLSGGGGTGKTVVVVHRGRALNREHPTHRILLTTFTTNLADALADSLRRLDPDVPLVNSLGQSGVFIPWGRCSGGSGAAVGIRFGSGRRGRGGPRSAPLGCRPTDIGGALAAGRRIERRTPGSRTCERGVPGRRVLPDRATQPGADVGRVPEGASARAWGGPGPGQASRRLGADRRLPPTGHGGRDARLPGGCRRRGGRAVGGSE